MFDQFAILLYNGGMRIWHLLTGDPLALTISADARLGATDYCNDQIWELLWRGGDPPALALHTTYGLRSRSMRLFPQFRFESLTISDPHTFPEPAALRRFAPNYLELGFSPFHGLAVQAEYWVPESQAVTGRLHVENTSRQRLQFDLNMIAQLTPTDGERMGQGEVDSATVLAGRSGNLAPVVIMTGSPQIISSPFPAYLHQLALEPGEKSTFTWAHAALADHAASLNLARLTLNRPWEAEIARIERLNARDLEIYTGDQAWDAALALSQVSAQRLLVGPTEALPAVSMVSSRQPDQGFSWRGDGGDYGPLWNGQTPLEAHYLSGYLLPGAAEQASGLLFNFLHNQSENGGLDWKPGLGGQHSQLLATPVLADLAWKIYQAHPDQKFLEQVTPKLLHYFQSWFSKSHDRDADGLPEWDHPLQTGFEDHAVFSRWHPWAQGVEISTVESPALGALLYNESQALMRMAELLQNRQAAAELRRRAARLRQGVEACWDAENSTYHYRDRDSHAVPETMFLGERIGSGLIEVHKSFETPVRLHLKLDLATESRRSVQVFVHGYSRTGEHRIEALTQKDVKWYANRGYLTGDRLYGEVEHLDLRGLEAEDYACLNTAGFCCRDHTLMLPLWAGIPRPRRAARLVEKTILNPQAYWQPYGFPACPKPPPDPEATVCRSVHLPVASLVGAGMLRYGYRAEAAELVRRMMGAVIAALREQHTFFRLYRSDTGHGLADPGAVGGLAPLGLFLQALGVQVLSPTRVALEGFNPYPWPVTVKYRGLTVMRQADKTQVIFPNGQTVLVDDPTPQIIALETESLV